MKNESCSFVLLSGGSGSRMHNNMPKQYMMLAGKPIIVHILERVDRMPEIDDVVIVCKPEYREIIANYIVNYSLKKIYCIAEAGQSRQGSVYNGLKAAKHNCVLLHEAARPFVKTEEFRALLNDDAENITFGSPISYTVLEQENNMISKLLERKKLVNIQLPQKFNRDQLLYVYRRCRNVVPLRICAYQGH